MIVHKSSTTFSLIRQPILLGAIKIDKPFTETDFVDDEDLIISKFVRTAIEKRKKGVSISCEKSTKSLTSKIKTKD